MKIFRTKSATGGLGVRLDTITSIQYTVEGDEYRTEISTTEGPRDAALSASELEALFQEWDAAL